MPAVVLPLFFIFAASAAEMSSDQLEFFEKRVRPILSDRCYKCHSTQSEKLKGGLLLDSREGVLKGGEDGPVVTPGAPEKSKLIEAINYQNPELQMPPKGKLTDEQIVVLTEWVKIGVPWPAIDSPKSASASAGFDLEKRRREHWAWQPIKPQQLPATRDRHWPSTPPDRFILARLEQNGLRPAAPTERRKLLRRLYFDLIGLPPKPEEVDAFLKDNSPKAYERLVDKLLASPHFGERWARHWLDLVRYAETLGHEFDYPVHNAWRYRDYVIRALNADVPYDQFVTEHIAGDLLPNPRRHPTEHFNESIIGTSFFWLGQRDHSPVDVRQHQAELIDNQIDVMSKTFLGLTVSCARCHDHKFDAISSKDFYGLYGVLESSRYAQRAVDSADQPKIQELKMLKNQIRQAAVAEWSKQEDEISKLLLLRYGATPSEPDDPFYPWIKLSTDPAKSPEELRHQWNTLVEQSKEDMCSTVKTNDEIFALADINRLAGWFADGDAFTAGAGGEGDFIVGKNNLIILHQPAVNDRVISRKLEGSLRSPGFELKHAFIHILAAGRDSRIRICPDNLTVIREPIYGGLMKRPEHDSLTWFTFDVSMWRGHRAFIEFSDSVVPDPADDQKKDGYVPGGWISASRVIFSDESKPPAFSGSPTWLQLLGTQPPDSLEALAARYQTKFRKALRTFESDKGHYSSEEQAQLAFLDRLLQKRWVGGRLSSFETESREGQSTADATPLKRLLSEYHRIESTLQGPLTVPAMVDGDGCDEHVFIRGNHKTPGELAPRQFITALSNRKSAPFKLGSGRLELARCMTDPSNPLLARVMVNRVWLHLFGRGIVPTPDDFGKLGQPPTHPELLDWLANWYRADARWSTRKLIRMLVMSSAYRMSSKPEDLVAEEKDPNNSLLHRMPIRRLEGEVIRDSMLAISGRLDGKMFGPPIPTYITEFMDGRGKPTSSGPMDGAGRRSIYLEVRRNFISPMMRTFDTPVAYTTAGKRTVSNVPAQSLILLNDPFVQGQAQLWAQHLLSDQKCSPEERVNRIYLAAFGRPSTAEEQTKALAFLRQQTIDSGLNASESLQDERGWADLCHVMYNLKEFIYIE